MLRVIIETTELAPFPQDTSTLAQARCWCDFYKFFNKPYPGSRYWSGYVFSTFIKCDWEYGETMYGHKFFTNTSLGITAPRRVGLLT